MNTGLQYDYNPGIDITGLFSVTQAQLQQQVAQIAPLDDIGGVLFGSGAAASHPDVTNNPRFVRYVWLDTQTPASVLIKVYQGVYPSDAYADWVTIQVADGSITAAKLANYAVSILNGLAASKIAYKQDGSADATKSNYLMRLDAAGQYVEIVSAATVLSALTLDIKKLDITGANDGNLLQYRSSDGFPSWQPITIAGLIGAGSLTYDRLSAGTAGYLLRLNNVTGIPEQVVNNDLLAAGGLFAIRSILLNRLDATGAANKDQIGFDGTNWVKRTPFYGSLGATLPAADGAVSVAHGLGTTPRKFGAYAIANGNDAATGYQIGDVINLSDIVTGVSPFPKLFTVWANATLVGVSYDLTTSVKIIPKAGGTPVAVTSVANFDMYAWAEL